MCSCPRRSASAGATKIVAPSRKLWRMPVTNVAVPKLCHEPCRHRPRATRGTLGEPRPRHQATTPNPRRGRKKEQKKRPPARADARAASSDRTGNGCQSKGGRTRLPRPLRLCPQPSGMKTTKRTTGGKDNRTRVTIWRTGIDNLGDPSVPSKIKNALCPQCGVDVGRFSCRASQSPPNRAPRLGLTTDGNAKADKLPEPTASAAPVGLSDGRNHTITRDPETLESTKFSKSESIKQTIRNRALIRKSIRPPGHVENKSA